MGARTLTPSTPLSADEVRLAEMMEAMIALAAGERVRPVDVRGDGSVLDGIATGLNMVADEIAERLERDRVREARLLEAERLAVAGQMAARVAHEVNNPASFLLANLTVLAEHAADLGRILATLRTEFPEGSQARSVLERVLAHGEADRIVAETGEICSENLEGVRRIAAVVRELNERALVPAGLAAGHAGATSAPAAAPPQPRRLRVLLVDDDPLLLTAYRRLLEQKHEVAVAEGGLQALELLERDAAWDAIVSDVVMPGVDGPELLRQLEARFPSLVARTAFSSAGTYTTRTVAFAESLGDRFVTKPLDRGQLEALVGRLGAT